METKQSMSFLSFLSGMFFFKLFSFLNGYVLENCKKKTSIFYIPLSVIMYLYVYLLIYNHSYIHPFLLSTDPFFHSLICSFIQVLICMYMSGIQSFAIHWLRKLNYFLKTFYWRIFFKPTFLHFVAHFIHQFSQFLFLVSSYELALLGYHAGENATSV